MSISKHPRLARVKQIAGFLVMCGTGTIVHQFIKNNVEADSNFQKVSVPAATLAVVGLISDKTMTYTDRAIDGVAEALDGAKTAFDEAKDEAKNNLDKP